MSGNVREPENTPDSVGARNYRSGYPRYQKPRPQQQNDSVGAPISVSGHRRYYWTREQLAHWARNLQIMDDLLILHREKIVPTYYRCCDCHCPSCRRDDGLSRAIVQEEKERTGYSRAGETQDQPEAGRSDGIHRGRQ